MRRAVYIPQISRAIRESVSDMKIQDIDVYSTLIKVMTDLVNQDIKLFGESGQKRFRAEAQNLANKLMELDELHITSPKVVFFVLLSIASEIINKQNVIEQQEIN